MKDKLRCLIKNPGCDAEEMIIEDRVSAFEAVLGGEYFITNVMCFNVAIFFTNHADNATNCSVLGLELYGPIIFTATTPQGVPVSLTDEDISFIKRYCLPPATKNKKGRVQPYGISV